ncbi:PREDICTED: DENN domain-containing protein 3-like, partial [Nanorana parkeri]|uniref:DENN domain-containing protein 3-like n=1 Tax=Nanorana parkeri TaxID=125878 RepID=UPI00085475A8
WSIYDIELYERTERVIITLHVILVLLLLSICGRDVKAHLNYEHRVFNSEEFLKTRSPADQPFYKKVLETYLFNSFLKARLNKKMDAFTQMEMDASSEIDGHSSILENQRRRATEKLKRFRPEHMFSKKLVISMPNLQDVSLAELPLRPQSLRRSQTLNGNRLNGKSFYTFRLPLVHYPLMRQCVQTYYIDLTNFLSKEITCLPAENSVLLARYFYLRGLVFLMQGKLLSALSDFQNLYKTDLRIFPAELVRKVVLSLPASERQQAENRQELKRLISQVLDKERDVPRADDHVKKFKLPSTHLHLEDFVRRIQESGIVKDIDTIHRLFDALTVGHQKQIDPDIFRDFYNYWKETEAEAEEVDLPSIVTEKLDQNEFVYKLSSSVKTNLGVGKIAMTQKRLFLLIEGRQSYEEIVAFRNIEDVKVSMSAFLLLRIPTLRIKTSTRKDSFDANLKGECELWNLMIKEMWAGRKMADNHKDPQYVQEALTNVLLMNAVVGALQTAKSIYAASKLSYFDKMKNEVPMMIPKTTSETLKHRINPSAGETTTQPVDVLLYTPGQLDKSGRDDSPKLWCALGEGKVVVFNASTWSIQQHCLKVGKAKLRCMVAVDPTHVWIGSSDSIIYIINIHSMSCNKQLSDHRHEVVDIVPEAGDAQKRLAYSCSAGGHVFAWDVNTLKIDHKFQLKFDITSMKLYNELLMYCKSPPPYPGLRCMVAVDPTHVWIGSSDSIIYIINIHSMSCNKQLSDHRHEVVDIVPEAGDAQKRLAYSCSAGGHVFAWDVNTLKIDHKFQLKFDITSMKLYNELLMYCKSPPPYPGLVYTLMY